MVEPTQLKKYATVKIGFIFPRVFWVNIPIILELQNHLVNLKDGNHLGKPFQHTHPNDIKVLCVVCRCFLFPWDVVRLDSTKDDVFHNEASAGGIRDPRLPRPGPMLWD